MANTSGKSYNVKREVTSNLKALETQPKQKKFLAVLDKNNHDLLKACDEFGISEWVLTQTLRSRLMNAKGLPDATQYKYPWFRSEIAKRQNKHDLHYKNYGMLLVKEIILSGLQDLEATAPDEREIGRVRAYTEIFSKHSGWFIDDDVAALLKASLPQEAKITTTPGKSIDEIKKIREIERAKEEEETNRRLEELTREGDLAREANGDTVH